MRMSPFCLLFRSCLCLSTGLDKSFEWRKTSVVVCFLLSEDLFQQNNCYICGRKCAIGFRRLSVFALRATHTYSNQSLSIQ